ncbi:hypothetical protein STEG23_025119, partial [Scotinomys teguina]
CCDAFKKTLDEFEFEHLSPHGPNEKLHISNGDDDDDDDDNNDVNGNHDDIYADGTDEHDVEEGNVVAIMAMICAIDDNNYINGDYSYDNGLDGNGDHDAVEVIDDINGNDNNDSVDDNGNDDDVDGNNDHIGVEVVNDGSNGDDNDDNDDADGDNDKRLW